MQMFEFRLEFNWRLFLRVHIPALVQIMAWRRPGEKPLSEPVMVSYWPIYASLGFKELTRLWGPGMRCSLWVWDRLVCDLIRTPVVMAKQWILLCPFFSNLHLRENLARDCCTSTASTVTTLYKTSLPVYIIVTNRRLQPLTTAQYNSLVLSYSLLKI